MIHGKELVKRFKLASWRTQREAEQFAKSVSFIETGDVLQCLDILTRDSKKGTSNENHPIRCHAFSLLGQRVQSKKLFLPYVRALKQGDSILRHVLAELIPLVNNVEGHDELCQHLRSTERELRQVTAEILKEIGGGGVMESLFLLVHEPRFEGLSEATEVAIELGGHRLIGILEKAVQKGTADDQVKALRCLGDRERITRNRAGASKAILPALLRGKDLVLEEAIRSYGAMSSERSYFDHVGTYLNSPNIRLEAAAIEGLRWFRSPHTIMTLTQKLQEGTERISSVALSALKELGDEAILPALVQGLAHKNINVRTQAQEALAFLGDSNKIDIKRAVLWLLRSENVQVRRRAVELARSVQDPNGEFWPQLLSFLRDGDWWVREQVTEALMDLAGRQLTRYLVNYLQEPSEFIRRWAVGVLVRLEDPDSLGMLVRAAQEDTDWWVRESAIEGMGVLKDQRALPYILALMQKEPELRWSCIQALEALGAEEAAPHVAALLDDESSEVQLAALKCLGTFNNFDYAGAVMPLLESEDPEVSREAYVLLHRWESLAAYETKVGEAKHGNPLDRLLLYAHEMGGEDLILAPNRKAYIKRLGHISPLSNHVFSADQLRAILLPQLNMNQISLLDDMQDVDFSYEVSTTKMRFRVNVFHQHGGVSAVFRHIESELATFEKLGLPKSVTEFGKLNHGLVVFGGPTGSGKSTTLAAIIDYINRHSNRHIISLEDPIEMVHTSKESLVNQREIGTHALSFDDALRATLRQDPDVILVGEMRDLPTISLAISAAETGHLVFGTLHTVSAETTVDRMINAFPSSQQAQIRSMLAQSLRAVVCQFLLKRKDLQGRCLASEVMINNDAIGNLIRKAKQFQIPSILATSREAGMQLMDQDLMRLYKAGLVDASEVYMKAKNKQDFEKFLEEREVDQRHRISAAMNIVVGTPLQR